MKPRNAAICLAAPDGQRFERLPTQKHTDIGKADQHIDLIRRVQADAFKGRPDLDDISVIERGSEQRHTAASREVACGEGFAAGVAADPCVRWFEQPDRHGSGNRQRYGIDQERQVSVERGQLARSYQHRYVENRAKGGLCHQPVAAACFGIIIGNQRVGDRQDRYLARC